MNDLLTERRRRLEEQSSASTKVAAKEDTSAKLKDTRCVDFLTKSAVLCFTMTFVLIYSTFYDYNYYDLTSRLASLVERVRVAQKKTKKPKLGPSF